MQSFAADGNNLLVDGEDMEATSSNLPLHSEKQHGIKKKLYKLIKIVLGGVVLVLACYIAYSISQTNNSEKLLASSVQNMDLNVGMRNEDRLQKCQGTQFKRTFPDVDYAFFGYNILKGYPLNIGHDPGFTLPIFKADYSEGLQTSDCRYFIPRGLVIVPDVSCITDFTSKTIQTRYEFIESLSISANVKASPPTKSSGGKKSKFSGEFKASGGYQDSSNELSNSKSVYILSTAECNYYFSKLMTDNAPPFSDSFLRWIHKLAATDEQQIYFNFFETYGTHFQIYTTFGARYTFEHKMKTKTFISEKRKGFNFGIFGEIFSKINVGLGFNIAKEEREKVEKISKDIETKTITVGAPPPANGDATTWASNVKESPVPMKYELESIDNLFTETYMAGLNVNYQRISLNIEKNKAEYCEYLKDLGQLDSCEIPPPGLVLKKTRLFAHFKEQKVSTNRQCIDTCLQLSDCEAITICPLCVTADLVCHMFNNVFKNDSDTSYRIRAETDKTDKEWETMMFISKINSRMIMISTTVVGAQRSSDTDTKNINTPDGCYRLCFNDEHCVAYTFHHGIENKVTRCRFFSETGITGLTKEIGTDTYFIPYGHP
ncbi:unnamed protein product [Mytilus edulis]|uniref:MACPF domain-containing protein n=1 Tax=Mytilus edulis TaxID=6550 RepID=A0A8S3VKE8_MYTED|nr:unnamed protein product [Mytilus edulis]